MSKEGTMAEEIHDENTGNDSPEQLAPPASERFKWYIIHAYSGFERKVRESLESRVQAFGLQNKIGRVMIPTEPVTEIVTVRSGQSSGFFFQGMCWSRWISTMTCGMSFRTRRV